MIMKNVLDSFTGKGLVFAKYGAIGGVIGDIVSEVIPDINNSLIHVGLWFGIIGGVIVSTLLYGQNKYLHKQKNFDLNLFINGFYGLVGGSLAGVIAQGLYSLNSESEFVRIICWGIAGGVLGYRISTRIPNVTKVQGSVGGFFGGFIGGFFFILIASFLGALLGRVAGCAIIGAAIGLMISITESVFREAWLEIWYSDKEKKQVTLGKDPIRIGSLNVCEVYISGEDMISYIYQMQDGIITRQDVTRKQTQNVVVGDTLQIGTMKIVLCGK
jgi:Ca-activated chloride channel family protein